MCNPIRGSRNISVPNRGSLIEVFQ
ncbi:hypothetical protein A2U01_0109339, partial [Trifolium medium]|nr:hypothetical protein [Trifolium medium]